MATFLIGFLSIFVSVNGITFHRWGGNGNWYPQQPHGPPPSQGGSSNYVPYQPNNNVAVGYPTAYSLGAFVRPNGGGGYEQQGSGNTSNRQLVRCMNGGAHIGHCRLDDDSICIALGGTCVNSVCCTTPFMSLSTTPAPTKAPHVIDGDAYQPKVRSSSEEGDVDGNDNTSKSRKHGRSGSNEDPDVDPTDVSPESRETTTFRPKPRSRKPTTTTMRPMESGSAESYEQLPRPTAPPVDGSVEKLSTIDEERLTEIDELSRLLELGRKSGLTTDSPIFNVFAGLFERKTKTTTPMPPMPMWPGGQMPMFPVFPEWFNRFTLPPPMPIATLAPAPIPTTTEMTTTEMTTKVTTTKRPTTATKKPTTRTTRKPVPKIVQIFPITTTTTTTTTTTERPTTIRTTTTPVNSVETSDSNESGLGLSAEDPEFDNYHRKTCDSGTRPIGPCTKDLSCPVDHSCEAGGICCYDYTMVLKRMRLAPANPNIYDFSQYPAMPMFSHAL